MIGPTTENRTSRSTARCCRAQDYELKGLRATDVELLLRRAVERDELPARAPTARHSRFWLTALAALELPAATAEDGHATHAVAEDALQRYALR